MQSRAKIVIIGGGVMGCSLAYHLCKEGESDVVLLEKAELTSGSTWPAAGQITHSVSHYSLAKMAAYGTELYPRLEDETGQSCTWHGSGSLRIAYTQDRSKTGLGLDLPEGVQPGELLRIRLRGIDGEIDMDALARVVWCENLSTGRARAGLAMLRERRGRRMRRVHEARRQEQPEIEGSARPESGARTAC